MEITPVLPIAKHNSRDISMFICIFFAVFQNNCVFVPQFLQETVRIFCVILVFSKTFLVNKRKKLLIGKIIQLWL